MQKRFGEPGALQASQPLPPLSGCCGSVTARRGGGERRTRAGEARKAKGGRHRRLSLGIARTGWVTEGSVGFCFYLLAAVGAMALKRVAEPPLPRSASPPTPHRDAGLGERGRRMASRLPPPYFSLPTRVAEFSLRRRPLGSRTQAPGLQGNAEAAHNSSRSSDGALAQLSLCCCCCCC